MLRFLPRGLFGRSFLNATVPQPVPSWTPADRQLRPRSDAIRPTPIKSFDRPAGLLAAPIRNTPGRAARSRGHVELARSRRDSLAESGESTLSQSQKCFSKVLAFMLHFFNLGGGQGNGGNRPERRARARRGMRVDHRVHPCSFSASFLFELSALNPSGVRGTPPKNLSSVLHAASRCFDRLQTPRIPGVS